MRVHDWFETHATARPDIVFLRRDGSSVSYAQADLWANRLANALIARGARIGDRAAWLSGNTPEMGMMFLGMSKAGVAPVMLNRHLAPREWLWILRDADPCMVFAQGEGHVAAIEALRPDLPPGLACVALDAAPPPGWIAGAALLDEAAETRPRRDVATDDLYYLIYTSGTTGHPKGVMLSHGNIIAHVEQSMAASSAARQPGSRALVATPLYHAAGALRIATAAINGTTIVLTDRFEPEAFVRLLEQERINTCNMVPAMLQRLLDEVPDIATRDFSALEVIYYGAAPVSVPLLRRALDVFRCDLIQGYGLTESTGGIAYLNEVDHQKALAGRPELLRATGRAVVLAEIRIVDEQDREVPRGTVGELVVRGPNVMKGYWRNPDATAEALRGGWLHSGDAASMDEDGYITLHDRLKDMVVSGAVNIYPREIENALAEHPAIGDVAVIGVPDPRWGEALLAVCVLRAGAEQPDDDALIAFCRERLGGFKVPRRYAFVDALPRNASGKVLKRVLREPYWSGETRGIA
ncbi:long-chain-fatty-acid--CoA ligase [Roseomonas sp. AR75]|uniref:long-chain-fatty-acid--CoA ligase n=1 Tax=Roseomonas sp. AR75 TaxID=2562311 RepID=UPI0010C00F0B|nr:long-chain-fatty-acid--CoA ligase [Roseomonas sp. AR75]